MLADGWTYSDWVVGTAHVRDVDDTWPRVGSRLHHRAGPWPFSLQDKSTVLECRAPHRLVLRAGLWPAGRGDRGVRARAARRRQDPGDARRGLRRRAVAVDPDQAQRPGAASS
ncbi:hypothetical protein V2I01_28445 [Micromonospora sp. BRA006-A]|nr:hypothetical protein [Micromonospora sp. BRA006-A]